MKKVLLISALSVGFMAFSAVPSQARTSDCSKPGNATKAVCKSTAKDTNKPAPKASPAKASAPKPVSTKVVTKTATKTTAQRNYDCSKAGNKNKAVCKTSVTASASPSVTKTVAPRQAPLTTRTTATGPNGATAACKDGTYSHSKVHRGACSRHGGVAKWFS